MDDDRRRRRRRRRRRHGMMISWDGGWLPIEMRGEFTGCRLKGTRACIAVSLHWPIAKVKSFTKPPPLVEVLAIATAQMIVKAICRLAGNVKQSGRRGV